MNHCNLVDNGGNGLYVISSTADGEGNWWGDAAGPTGTHGDGDGASAGVDSTPWLTAPYVLPYVP